MTREEANAMTREEITATLRAIDPDSDHDCYMAAFMFIPAADLLDQQAARIAELEAAVERALSLYLDLKQTAENNIRKGWFAGRDEAAEVMKAHLYSMPQKECRMAAVDIACKLIGVAGPGFKAD
jgi:hypothetical protein